MRLHILTACSRPDNLPTVGRSIVAAAWEPWELCWHVRFDLDREHVGGQKLKNDMLDEVESGWVFFLDDDTIMHPGLLKAVTAAGADAVVVSQIRTDGRYLKAAPENLRVGDIDIGQAVIRRSVIGPHRLPLNYEGDGHFLVDVLAGTPNVAYIDAALSYHNALDRVLIA